MLPSTGSASQAAVRVPRKGCPDLQDRYHNQTGRPSRRKGCQIAYGLVVNNSTSDAAELSSVLTALEDLKTRCVVVADRWRSTEREDISSELYEVERSVRAAIRRANKAMRLLEEL